MISLQMIPISGLNLQPPQSNQAKQLPHSHRTVESARDGFVVVKGKHYSDTGLEAFLAQDRNLARTQNIIVADKVLPFQDFIHVMEAYQKVGMRNIVIAATPSLSLIHI